MAKIYNHKTHKIMWSDSEVYFPVEEAYFELTELLACKKLDGHDREDQWYMLVQLKLKELLEAMEKCPYNELDEHLKPIY